MTLIQAGARDTFITMAAANLTPDTLGWGIVLSVAATAVRAAVKAVVESFAGTTADIG